MFWRHKALFPLLWQSAVLTPSASLLDCYLKHQHFCCMSDSQKDESVYKVKMFRPSDLRNTKVHRLNMWAGRLGLVSLSFLFCLYLKVKMRVGDVFLCELLIHTCSFCLCQLIQFLFSQMQSNTPSTVGLKRKLWVDTHLHTQSRAQTHTGAQ